MKSQTVFLTSQRISLIGISILIVLGVVFVGLKQWDVAEQKLVVQEVLPTPTSVPQQFILMGDVGTASPQQFAVIDTEQFGAEAQQWLTTELNTSSKRWKIVLGHRPLISEEKTKKGENWHGKKELQDIVCQSADYYISGHAHILEDRGVLPDCKVHALISGTGGSYVRQVAQPFTGSFYAEENGFLSLTLNATTADYAFIHQTGKRLD